MLVLTRKAGEKINIGNDIVVSVVQINGNKVRISIDAPNDVRILRGELIEWTETAKPALQEQVNYVTV